MPAVHITLNGQPLPLDPPCTVAEIVALHAPTAGLFAVAVNDAIVPRSQHASTELRADDRVEIVHAVGGG